MSCNICYNDFKKNCPNIACMYCNFEACRTCCETYILSEQTPKCMKLSCGKEWSRKFLREKFTNSFLINKFKKHIESILFDREKALLPATQPLVQEKIRKKNIRDRIKEIDNQMKDLQNLRRALDNQYYHTQLVATPLEKEKEKEKGHGFVRQCPADGCRGFLSTQWKCGLCEKWTCPDCHELKGLDRNGPHTCDPNSVETAKILKKDSKPCPKCQSLIFKISGCDQMWCPQCKTAFSWKTGNIETGHIHNPHFYDWKFKQGLETHNFAGGGGPGAHLDPCGLNTLVSGRIVNSAYKLGFCTDPVTSVSYRNFEPVIELICKIIRNNIHNAEVELRHFQVDYFEKNIDLRIKYLENIITEEELKTLVQRNDKKHRKNIEISQIVQLSNAAINDIVLRIDNYLEKWVKKGSYIKNKNEIKNEINNGLKPFLKELEALRIYCNDILNDIAFTYNSVQYAFNDEFKFEKEKDKADKKNDKKDDKKDDKKNDNLKKGGSAY